MPRSTRLTRYYLGKRSASRTKQHRNQQGSPRGNRSPSMRKGRPPHGLLLSMQVWYRVAKEFQIPTRHKQRTMTKRCSNPRRIESISFWCRVCWFRGALDVEWQILHGKTLEDIRLMCNEAHAKQCPTADVRLGNATKTRTARR